MPHLVFTDFGFAADFAAAINGCTTIDSSTNDNGFLGCARAGNPGAGQDGSTADAVQNLLNCVAGGRRPANIVGHGNDGLIVTGQGQSPSDPNKYLHMSNRPYWEPQISRLRDRVSNLSLWACHPGTGDAGADFLFRIAQLVNVNVAGPTGFLYCQSGNLWLEANSVWQVATPTARPNPIQAPTPHFRLFMNMNLIDRGESKIVDLDDIVSVSYIPLARNPDATRPSLSLTDDDARSFLQLIAFDSPFQPGGIPAAIATGKLLVTYRVKGVQEPPTRTFLVYNNRLVQDIDSPDTYYLCYEAFGDTLLSL